MLGSLGSQLGALQLGSVPSGAVNEGITGSLTVTIGPPTITATGSLPVLTVIGPAPPPRRPFTVRGSLLVEIRPPCILGHGVRGIGGQAAIEIGPPTITAHGALTIQGAVKLALAGGFTARGTVTNRGQAAIAGPEPTVNAKGLVGRSVVRPRLRSILMEPQPMVPSPRRPRSAPRPARRPVVPVVTENEDDVLNLLEIG